MFQTEQILFFLQVTVLKKKDTETLLSCGIFRGLNENDIAAAEKEFGFDMKDFVKNELIFSPDDFRNALAVIMKGKAEVFKSRGGSAPMLMSIQGKGAVFGIPTLFCEEKAFPTTVRAKEDCRILFIDRTELEKLFVRYPVMVNNYLSLLSEKIFFLNEKLEKLSSPDIRGRLRTYLENTAESKKSKEFVLPLSCSELASSLSVGRTSLYRAFDELTEEGFLTRDGKNIRLL